MQKTILLEEKKFEEFLANRKDPVWLLDYRKKNFDAFKKMPFKKSQYVDLQKLEALLGLPVKKNALPKTNSQKVSVLSFENALKTLPEKIRLALESEHAPKDRFEAFINAFFDNGFVVFVQKSQHGQKIMLEVIPENLSMSKNFFFFEEQNIAVFEKISGQGVFALSETVFLEKNAMAQIVRLHEHAVDSTGFFYNQSIVQNNALLENSNAWLNGMVLRSNTFNNLHESNAGVKQFDALLLGKEQVFDLNNTAVHISPNSSSYTLFKGIVAQKSKSVFDAMIKIEKNAQKSNAFLEAHSMLLSPNASSNNIPGLEIEADDVKATHSASICQIEEEQVFYLESRGISRKQAVYLIVSSFLESVLLKLDKELNDIVFKYIEKKLLNI